MMFIIRQNTNPFRPRQHSLLTTITPTALTIPGILKTSIGVIQNEDYLLPIVFKCNTGTQGRRRLKVQMLGDVDDGCMRSIALVVSGVKKIRVYFGTPR